MQTGTNATKIKDSSNYRAFTLRLPEELGKELDRVAKETDRTATAVIRVALRNYIAARAAKAQD